MHSSEQRAAEYASNTQHVEWVHQDVMFRLNVPEIPRAANKWNPLPQVAHEEQEPQAEVGS